MTGCCDSCRGTGCSGDVETGGVCWDCQGTGHPHLQDADHPCIPYPGESL